MPEHQLPERQTLDGPRWAIFDSFTGDFWSEPFWTRREAINECIATWYLPPANAHQRTLFWRRLKNRGYRAVKVRITFELEAEASQIEVAA